MAIGSGIGSQVGFSAESVYGTYVAPTKFLRGKTYNATRTQERPQGEGIQTGIAGPMGDHFVETTNAATGSLGVDVTTNGWGVLLQGITGGTSTSVLSGTTAYTQTHTLGDPYGKSVTFQIGVPYRSGTVACKTLTGCKVTGAEFSAGTNEILSATVNFDAQKYDEGQSLAAASYTSSSVFHGKLATLKLGTYGAEAALAGVTSVSLNWNKALDVDDYYLNASGLKTEPVLNGDYDISGSISADWTTAVATALHDRMIGNTSTSLVWEFVGTNIETTYYRTIRFTVPGVFFSGDTQSVSGKDALNTSYNFNWKYDGTNLPKIEYITTDTAL